MKMKVKKHQPARSAPGDITHQHSLILIKNLWQQFLDRVKENFRKIQTRSNITEFSQKFPGPKRDQS